MQRLSKHSLCETPGVDYWLVLSDPVFRHRRKLAKTLQQILSCNRLCMMSNSFLTHLKNRLLSPFKYPQMADSLITAEQKSFFSQFIKASDICFDIGANTGHKADIFLSLGTHVVCIEPQPACINILKRKYQNN